MRVAALVVLLLLLTLSPAASARRVAGPNERAEIEVDIGIPADCQASRISTVDRRWGTTSTTNESGCPQGNGVIVIHRGADGYWEDVFQGSEVGYGVCPFRNGVPRRVDADLKLCELDERVYFVDWLGEKLIWRPRGMPDSAHSYFEHTRWTRWTRSFAQGRATLLYSDLYTQFRSPVRVRLYRPRTCARTGVRIFTRRRLTAAHAGDRRRLRGWTRETRYGGSCDKGQYWPRSKFR